MIDQKIIPLKVYPGRKGAAGAWQQIISEIPKCDLFIDAMCGSGLIASLVVGCKKIVNVLSSIIDNYNYVVPNPLNPDLDN